MMQPTIRFTQFNEELKESKLGLLVDIFRGASPRPKSDPKYYGGPIPRLMIEDVTRDGKYVTPKIDSLTLEGAKKSRLLEKGSLVLSCSGTRVAIPGILNNDACIHDGFFGFKNYKNIDREFLYYFFVKLHESIQASATKGATFNNLTTEIMKTMSFIVPSLEEQREIASFFNLMDQKIKKQQEKIEKLEQFKKGMMQKIFSQELRFKDEDGGDFGEWKEVLFEEIITTFSGGTPLSSNPKYYNGEIPFIRSGEIYTDKTELFITDEGFQSSSAKMVNEGDLLLALYGATSGGIAVSKINGAINQAILCIRSKQHIPFIMYYWEYKKENILKTYLQGGQGNISASIVKSIDISLPIIEEQIKIGSFFADIAKKVDKEKEKLLVLEEQKKGFMQGMFV